MRARIGIIVMLVGVALVSGCADTGSESNVSDASAAFAKRSVRSGEVDISVQPERIDASGASFKVVFDTHSVELSMDVAAGARLQVGDTFWPGAEWTGAGPGGHHREGTLRFAANGRPTGMVRLYLSGLPESVEVTWSVGG